MREPSLKALILRAVIITLAVLGLLFALRHSGILSVSEDPPAPDQLVTASALDSDSDM